MTDHDNEDGAAELAPTRLISVVDAVCCVYFRAAGKSSLLLRILVELGMEILIPAEVEREVLSRLRSSSRVQILDELTATQATRDSPSSPLRTC